MTITIIRGSQPSLTYRDLTPGCAYRGSDGALYLALKGFSSNLIVMQLQDEAAPLLDFCLVKDECAIVSFTEVDITITEGAAK
jgi:hypothetical protein